MTKMHFSVEGLVEPQNRAWGLKKASKQINLLVENTINISFLITQVSTFSRELRAICRFAAMNFAFVTLRHCVCLLCFTCAKQLVAHFQPCLYARTAAHRAPAGAVLDLSCPSSYKGPRNILVWKE